MIPFIITIDVEGDTGDHEHGDTVGDVRANRDVAVHLFSVLGATRRLTARRAYWQNAKSHAAFSRIVNPVITP
jgi:hypothetical protein